MLTSRISQVVTGVSGNTQCRRHLWQYVCQAFNRVDVHRLKIVGPNRMCAEWVLKNGGAVRFTENTHILHSQYNSLPAESAKIAVAEIDGTKSTIMSLGFEHLKDCRDIKKIILDNCKYLDDEAGGKLHYVQSSLEELSINRCRNLSREGILELIKSVPQLKRLELGTDMPLVKDMDSLVTELRKHLPKCEITVNK